MRRAFAFLLLTALERRHLLQHLPWTDVYTNRTLDKSDLSVEHIVPRRFFSRRRDADCIDNLAFTSKHINQMRSDLAFHELKIQPNTTSHNCTDYVISRTARTFAPTHPQALKGLLARSIVNVVQSNPELRPLVPQLVTDMELLRLWSKTGERSSPFERARDQLKETNRSPKDTT